MEIGEGSVAPVEEPFEHAAHCSRDPDTLHAELKRTAPPPNELDA